MCVCVCVCVCVCMCVCVCVYVYVCIYTLRTTRGGYGRKTLFRISTICRRRRGDARRGPAARGLKFGSGGGVGGSKYAVLAFVYSG